LTKLKPQKADDMFGKPSGAGVIYGATGGVMESAFRTAYEKLTNKKLSNVEFKQVRGMQGIKEAEVKIGSSCKKIAVINGLGLAKKFLQEIKSGKRKGYACIELMACSGGCIGGGGQPMPIDDEIRNSRIKTLYQIDEKKKNRKAHENPIVKKIYKEFFKDKEIAHKILHTSYSKKTKGLVKII
jgi:iron only hydrogenase large subunit-like protein